MNTNIATPAFPTTPMQDKYGQVHVSFGFSKLEYAAIIIAAQLSQSYSDKCLPETIAEEAVQIALSTLEECENELKKINNPASKIMPSA